MSLTVTQDGETKPIDNFFKTLMFIRIMDGDFSRNERDVLLVIFRKTVHFNKWDDRIGIHAFSKHVGVSLSILRRTIKDLVDKKIIDENKSKGGRIASPNKFNEYTLSTKFVFEVVEQWEKIKSENE